MKNLGILGLGEGRSVLTACQSMAEWNITSICDLDEELLASTQEAFGIDKATVSYSELLEDADLDAVMIYTPDSLHAEHILQAFEAGKHVICTKPLVDSLDDGPALLKAYEQTDREFIVGQTARFFPTFQRQREDFLAGLHGQVVSCESHYNGDKRLGSAGRRGKNGEVNWLYSGLIHPVDLIYWHLGPIEKITGLATLSPAGERLGSKVPDSFHAVLQASSGAIGQMSGIFGAAQTHDAAHPMCGCSIRGDKGSSVAAYPRFDYATNYDSSHPTQVSFPDGGEYFPFGGAKYHVGEMRNLLRYFSECLDSQTAPEPSLKDGLYAVAILQALDESIQSGKTVSVSNILSSAGLGHILES